MKAILFRILPVLFLLFTPSSGSTAGGQSNFFMPQNAMRQTTATDEQIGATLQKQLTRQQYLQKQRQALQQQKLKRQTGNAAAKAAETGTVAGTVKNNGNTGTVASGSQSSSQKRTAVLNKKPEKIINTPLLTQDKDSKTPSDTVNKQETKTAQTAAQQETQTAATMRQTPQKTGEQTEQTQTGEKTVKQTKLAEAENTQPPAKPQKSESPEISLQNPYEAAMQDYQKDLELIRKGEELKNTRLEAMLKDFTDKEHIIRVQ